MTNWGLNLVVVLSCLELTFASASQYLKLNHSTTFESNFFNTPLNNFDEVSPTFSLKVLHTNDFCGERSCSCSLFYAGGEGEVESFVENTLFLQELASRFSCNLVYAEHRWYGESIPGMNTIDPTNYTYLTSYQAMADFERIARNFSIPNTKTIAIGGSYGGMLAAWMRLTYPGTFDGAFASSASVLYPFEEEYSDTDLYEIVSDDFEECREGIHSAFLSLRELSTSELFANIQDILGLCEAPINQVESNNTIALLQQSLTNVAQLDYPFETNFLFPLPANPVNKACELFAELGGGIAGLRNAASLTLGEKDQCIEVSLEHFHSFAPGLIDGPWAVQRCTDLVMPATVGEGNKMYLSCSEFDQNCFYAGHESQAEFCKAVYGVDEIFPNDETKKNHGGVEQFNDIGNIIFSYGSLDIWSGAGRVQNDERAAELDLIWIEGGAHHADLRGANEADPPSFAQARARETEIIGGWLA